MKKVGVFIGVFCSIAALAGPSVQAAPSGGGSSSSSSGSSGGGSVLSSTSGLQEETEDFFKQGKKAVDAKQYDKAVYLFEQALQEEPGDPDTLNMLAFSLRHTGELDEAIETYKKALKRRAHFPEAHEYMGEAYIQAALREVETLSGYGSSGEEDKKELIEAFKEAAAKL